SPPALMPGVLSARGPIAHPARSKPAKSTINKERRYFLVINLLRYRIKTALIEWVAAHYALHTHPPTFQGTVFIYCLVSIVRTSRIKPAGIGRQSFRKCFLIYLDQQ